MKFEITENIEQLLIKQTSSSKWMQIGKELIGFLFSLIVLVFPYDQLIAINKALLVIYFIPFLPLVRVYKSFVAHRNGLTFELDKQRNRLIKNGKVIDQLSNIKQVQWNIDSVIDHEESYLELLSSNDQKHRVSTTVTFMNKEHLELGKRLAKFLKIEFHNNNPLEKEVLFYGQNDLSEDDLKFIENKGN